MSELKPENIKVIMFDSGRVLNCPASGHWFITPHFFDYVDKRCFRYIGKNRINGAFNKAAEYILKQNLIMDEKEEFVHFAEYYRIFSEQLPELKLSESKIKSIAGDLVYNYDKYEFYKDAIEVIPVLSEHYKLAVVSDAWPSLENVFIKSGLRQYFSSFIISSEIGVTKPDELIYRTALEELDAEPYEAIFIDDNIKNCESACKLGIHSFTLCRDWRVYFFNRYIRKNKNAIHNLYEINKILKCDYINV